MRSEASYWLISVNYPRNEKQKQSWANQPGDLEMLELELQRVTRRWRHSAARVVLSLTSQRKKDPTLAYWLDALQWQKRGRKADAGDIFKKAEQKETYRGISTLLKKYMKKLFKKRRNTTSNTNCT